MTHGSFIVSILLGIDSKTIAQGKVSPHTGPKDEEEQIIEKEEVEKKQR